MGSAACTGIDCCDKMIGDVISPNFRSDLGMKRLKVIRKPSRSKRRVPKRDCNQKAAVCDTENNFTPERSCHIMYANNQIYQSDNFGRENRSRSSYFLPEVPYDLFKDLSR